MANPSKKQTPAEAPKRVPKGHAEPLRYLSLPPTQGGPEEVGSKISKMIEGSLNHEPIEIDAETSLKSGSEILAGLYRPLDRNIAIESGTSRQQLNLTTHFKGKRVVGMTLPGQRKKSGLYPENMDGIAIIPDERNDNLTIFLSHVDGYDPEDAAMSNTAVVTAAYETGGTNAGFLKGRKETEKFEQVFQYAEDSVNPVRDEFRMGKDKKVDVLGARIVPDPERESYRLVVANNGKSHCLVIDPNTGKFESSKQGVRKPGSERAVEKPVTDEFILVSNEYVVIASDALVEAFGDEGKLAKAVFDLLKDNENPQNCRALMRDLVKRQEDGVIVDSSASLVVFKVPKYKPHEFEHEKPPKYED